MNRASPIARCESTRILNERIVFDDWDTLVWVRISLCSFDCFFFLLLFLNMLFFYFCDCFIFVFYIAFFYLSSVYLFLFIHHILKFSTEWNFVGPQAKDCLCWSWCLKPVLSPHALPPQSNLPSEPSLASLLCRYVVCLAVVLNDINWAH